MAFTFFFRDLHTLEQLADKFLKTVDGKQKIKIWDAGCAMGPEPYTFLILLSERMNHFAFRKVFLDASDIDENNTFNEIIKEGIYSFDEIKRVPQDILKKHFEKIGDTDKYQIDYNIKSKLTFYKHDLTTLEPIGNNYDLIICKNVLLHLQPPQRIDVFKMFHSVLNTNGFLVMEQTQPLPKEVGHLFESMSSNSQIFAKR